MIDLPENQLKQVQNILNRLTPNTPVWAFESRVLMTANQQSDLDIVGKQKPPQTSYYALKDAFEESDLPIKVDVLDWHRLSSEFQENIKDRYIPISPKQQ